MFVAVKPCFDIKIDSETRILEKLIYVFNKYKKVKIDLFDLELRDHLLHGKYSLFVLPGEDNTTLCVYTLSIFYTSI